MNCKNRLVVSLSKDFKCNYDCSYCFHKFINIRSNFFNIYKFSLNNKSPNEIIISFGEPLLFKPKLFELRKLFYNSNLELYTNFSLINRYDLIFLDRVKYIISLNGINNNEKSLNLFNYKKIDIIRKSYSIISKIYTYNCVDIYKDIMELIEITSKIIMIDIDILIIKYINTKFIKLLLFNISILNKKYDMKIGKDFIFNIFEELKDFNNITKSYYNESLCKAQPLNNYPIEFTYNYMNKKILKYLSNIKII